MRPNFLIFYEINIKKNDNIFLHGDAFVTADLVGNNLNDKMETLFEGIISVIGLIGELIVRFYKKNNKVHDYTTDE